MAYSNGIPSPVVFAGPQKQIAIVTSGEICRKRRWLQGREARIFGGREA